MKKHDQFLRDYFYRLSDENLKIIHSRLHFKYQGDVPEVLNFVCNNRDIDRWLVGAECVSDFFGMIDSMQESVNREYMKRFGMHR